MNEKIEKIRMRLEAGLDDGSLFDRATLLAEIDRLRSDRRERIATAALQGLLSNSSTSSSAWEIVVAATVYADALIAKLDEEPQP